MYIRTSHQYKNTYIYIYLYDIFNFYTNIVYIHNCNIVVPLEFILTITYKDIIAATVSGTNNFSSTTDTNPRIDLLLQYVLE
jgi:hypothetical protein